MCQKIVSFTGSNVTPYRVCRLFHRNGCTRKKVQDTAYKRERRDGVGARGNKESGNEKRGIEKGSRVRAKTQKEVEITT